MKEVLKEGLSAELSGSFPLIAAREYDKAFETVGVCLSLSVFVCFREEKKKKNLQHDKNASNCVDPISF